MTTTLQMYSHSNLLNNHNLATSVAFSPPVTGRNNQNKFRRASNVTANQIKDASLLQKKPRDSQRIIEG